MTRITTRWVDEEAIAEDGTGVVAKAEAASLWYAGLTGETRKAVRFTLPGGRVYYLDNEDGLGWERATNFYAGVPARGIALSTFTPSKDPDEAVAETAADPEPEAPATIPEPVAVSEPAPGPAQTAPAPAPRARTRKG